MALAVGSEDLRVDPTPQGPQGRPKGRPQEGGEAPPPERRQQEAQPQQEGPGGRRHQGRTNPRPGGGCAQAATHWPKEGAPQATPTQGGEQKRN